MVGCSYISIELRLQSLRFTVIIIKPISPKQYQDLDEKESAGLSFCDCGSSKAVLTRLMTVKSVSSVARHCQAVQIRKSSHLKHLSKIHDDG